MNVVAEKGTLLWAAMVLIGSGAALAERGEYVGGLCLILIGLCVTVIREEFKIGRWSHAATYWRGKKTGG